MAGEFYDPVDIKGIPIRKDQKPPLRMECNEWAEKHPIQLSLYIRALQRLYDTPWTRTLSYFQIAGIHGYPGQAPWDKADPPKRRNRPEDTHTIYCAHNTLDFPTWHRPYMLLFEQRIHQLMLLVIEDLAFISPHEEIQWIREANKWRLPYWDWGLKPFVGVPRIYQSDLIRIRSPRIRDHQRSHSEEVHNPLRRFQVKNNAGNPIRMGDLPHPYKVDDNEYKSDDGKPLYLPSWSQFSGTSRWALRENPDESDFEGVNSFSGVEAAITKHNYYQVTENNASKEIVKHPLCELVYRLLAPREVGGKEQSFLNFATTRLLHSKEGAPQTWLDYINIEYLHNNMHVFTGGPSMKVGLGHMGDVPVAAFDPIFYMHHSFVDRQLAIWQTLNPTKWFGDEGQDPIKDPKGEDPLVPFRYKSPSGEFKYWTSDYAREWTKFGYQYDILERREDETEDEHVKRIVESLKKNYANDLPFLKKNPEAVKDKQVSADGIDGVYDDYVIEIIYDRYALGGDPYNIHFFLGKVSDEDINAHKYGADFHPNHFATISTFSSSFNNGEGTSCANCAQQAEAGALSAAFVPFSVPVAQYALTQSKRRSEPITMDEVGQDLPELLHWKATDMSGRVIRDIATKLPRTRIFVEKGKVTHYKEPGKPPKYEGYGNLVQTTSGKAWGATASQYEHPFAGLSA